MANSLNFTGIKGLHYVHGNIRSLFNKFSQIKEYLLDSNIACLELSETWLTSNIPNIMLHIPGYQLIKLDREWANQHGQTKKGGGICCYFNTKINFTHNELANLNSSTKDIEIFHVIIEQPFIKKCF